MGTVKSEIDSQQTALSHSSHGQRKRWNFETERRFMSSVSRFTCSESTHLYGSQNRQHSNHTYMNRCCRALSFFLALSSVSIVPMHAVIIKEKKNIVHWTTRNSLCSIIQVAHSSGFRSHFILLENLWCLRFGYGIFLHISWIMEFEIRTQRMEMFLMLFISTTFRICVNALEHFFFGLLFFNRIIIILSAFRWGCCISFRVDPHSIGQQNKNNHVILLIFNEIGVGPVFQ